MVLIWHNIALVVLAASSISLSAQNQQPDPNFYPHNIGAGAGVSTGLGLSYRHWFPNTYGLQINLIPYVNNTDGYKNRFISGGLTGLKILKQARMVNLFGYIGVHGLYRNLKYLPDTIITYEKSTTCFIGMGPGIDVHFWKLSLNIMAGIAGRFVNRDDWGMQMAGETALYYTF
jgi:hypothetical protein